MVSVDGLIYGSAGSAAVLVLMFGASSPPSSHISSFDLACESAIQEQLVPEAFRVISIEEEAAPMDLTSYMGWKRSLVRNDRQQRWLDSEVRSMVQSGDKPILLTRSMVIEMGNRRLSLTCQYASRRGSKHGATKDDIKVSRSAGT
jgi:hypothetical protein